MRVEIAIVGIPRSGTTFLYRSIAGLPPGAFSPPPSVYKSLPFIKAHSLAPPHSFGDPYYTMIRRHVDGGGKVIFLFRDPIEAVISTKLRRWSPEHALNCGYRGDLKKTDIFVKDHFSYERMFDTWMNPKGYQVLCIRYETMPFNFKEIEEYLGRKISWNLWIWVKRKNKKFVDAVELKKIERTYAKLNEKILLAKNIELRGYK